VLLPAAIPNGRQKRVILRSSRCKRKADKRNRAHFYYNQCITWRRGCGQPNASEGSHCCCLRFSFPAFSIFVVVVVGVVVGIESVSQSNVNRRISSPYGTVRYSRMSVSHYQVKSLALALLFHLTLHTVSTLQYHLPLVVESKKKKQKKKACYCLQSPSAYI
jgi:hypothetical protein